jgi:putative transposase
VAENRYPDNTSLKQASLRRLLAVKATGPVPDEYVAMAARGLGVHKRTVWRWLKAADNAEMKEPRGLVLTHDLRIRLAFWRGNVRALHRELEEDAAKGVGSAPSLPTLYRAVNRALTPGELAGLRKGEQAARGLDVYLRRPETHRNAAWEGDHAKADVEVTLDGAPVRPWVTWFIDTAHSMILGMAVSPSYPGRGHVLAALRAAISTAAPYGPAGGLPMEIRIDRGKDFLSKTVGQVADVLLFRRTDLPGYSPYLKGSIEGLNSAFTKMFCAGLPRYTKAATLANGKPADPDGPALSYEAFVDLLLKWVDWWNRHPMDELDGLSPLESWANDPTPLTLVPAEDLRLFTMEDDGKERLITKKGVSWSGRHYVGDWTGMVGTPVRIRYMPNHDHEIEVFHARSGAHLGRAVLCDQAPPNLIKAVRRSRNRRSAQLARDLRAAEKLRRQRYAAQTEAGPAQPIGAMTTEQARAELADENAKLLGSQACADAVPLGPPAPGWVIPRRRAKNTAPAAETTDKQEGP